MILYNLTIKVNNEIAGEWVRWQIEEHIPEIMATSLFVKNNFFKLLEQDDRDGPTYVLQYLTDSREKYETYINEYAPALAQKAVQKWGDGFVIFRTVMQTVH